MTDSIHVFVGALLMSGCELSQNLFELATEMNELIIVTIESQTRTNKK